jgi:hypothetical protein
MVTPWVVITVEHQQIARLLPGEAYNTGPAAGRGALAPLKRSRATRPPPLQLLRSRAPSPLIAFIPGLRTMTRKKER